MTRTAIKTNPAAPKTTRLTTKSSAPRAAKSIPRARGRLPSLVPRPWWLLARRPNETNSPPCLFVTKERRSIR